MYRKSALTAQLVKLLENANGTVSYGQLCAHLNLPLDAFRGALTSARRALEREKRIVFATEKGVGLRRLSDAEVVQTTHAIRQGMHRRAKAGLTRLDAVQDFNALPPAEQITHTINRTVFALVQDQTRRTARQ